MGMYVHVLQQENSPPSIMHGRQVRVHHSPTQQLPFVSPPTQEDLWHLPGRLRKSMLLSFVRLTPHLVTCNDCSVL